MQFVLAVAVVVVTVQQTTAQQGFPTGNSDDPLRFSNYSKVPCDFEDNNLCGWTTINAGYQLTWTMDKYGNNGYASLDVDYKGSGDKGGLSSPWLTPRPGHSCQLTFRYLMERSDGCKLTLFRETAQGGRTKLWTTTKSDGFRFSMPIDIECSTDRYRLRFEGERISNRWNACGWTWNEIIIDDIEYHLYPDESSTSPTTSRRRPTTTLTGLTTPVTSESPTAASSSDQPMSVSSPATTSANRQPQTSTTASRINNETTTGLPHTDAGGPDTGRLAGIAVVVILVIVIAVIFVVLVVRCRNPDCAKTDHCLTKGSEKRSQPSSDSTRVLGAVDNPFYMSPKQRISVIAGFPERPRGDNADSDHVYAAPDETYFNVSNDNDAPHRGYELAARPHHRHGASSSEYSHLHLKGSKAVSSASTVDADNYDHTLTPKGREPAAVRDAECSALHAGKTSKTSPPGQENACIIYENTAMARNHAGSYTDNSQGGRRGHDGRSVTRTVDASSPSAAETAAIYAAAGTTDYETADNGGRLARSSCDHSSDIYNRLTRSAERSVGQEVHQSHYDHFNGPAGTGAEYSSLGLEERARDLQREMAEGDYSHI